MAPSSITTDLLLFAVTAAVALTLQKRASASAASTDGTCQANGLKNSAFVFVKPHANTPATQTLVREKLTSAGIDILSESDIDGETIDSKKLIDQHYYAIASKATILPASEIAVPADKFSETFGESWETVLNENRACNAMEACKRFGCDASELDAAWQNSKVVKFGGGFYCGLVSVKGKPAVYVFNAFFMSMRSKFVGKGTSIHCYEVEWEPSKLSWHAFRNTLLGPTDPADGPVGSIRRTILDTYKTLGLATKPNKGDNGVHASASPFEGLAEKNNWLGKGFEGDGFGKALLESGIPLATLKEWSVDPRVPMPDGSKGSIFDALEDLDAQDCLAKMSSLYELGANLI